MKIRTKKEIQQAEQEFLEKLWWVRHQTRLIKNLDNSKKLTMEQKTSEKQAKGAAQKIEKKNGLTELMAMAWDDYECGKVNGKLSTIRWLMGHEWDFLDT